MKFKSLKNNQIFLKYFKNTSWLFLERLLRMGIGFFVIIWLTRYLGPERFGVLSYSQSFIAIFSAIATLGINVIAVRELVKNKEKENILLGTSFLLKLIVAIICIVIIIIINLFIEDKDTVLITNIISFSIIFQSFSTIDNFFNAKVLAKYTSVLNILLVTMSSTVKILLIYIEADLEYFAYALVFDALTIAIGYIYIYYLKNRSILSWRYDKDTAIYFLKRGWPLLLTTMAAFIYTRIDQMMLMHMIGKEAVGHYSAAVRVGELFYFIPILITQSLFPRIIEIKEKGEISEYFSLLEKLSSMLVYICVPIAISLFLFSEDIIFILFGEAYMEAQYVLNYLAFGIIFSAISSFFTKILHVENYERKYLYRSVLGIFVNIILNLYFIHFYGTIGAAIATIITLFIINYIYDLFDKDLYKFYYLKWKCFVVFKI